uniref:Uncharacterized protein n=1 Tax=Plectus sambesii TaxID=2011161 RepID=A0A914W009_9BILA
MESEEAMPMADGGAMPMDMSTPAPGQEQSATVLKVRSEFPEAWIWIDASANIIEDFILTQEINAGAGFINIDTMSASGTSNVDSGDLVSANVIKVRSQFPESWIWVDGVTE